MPKSYHFVERSSLSQTDQGKASGIDWAANLIEDLSYFCEVNGLSSTGKELRGVLTTLSVEISERVVRPGR